MDGTRAAGIEAGRRIRGDGYPDAIELLYSSSALFEDIVSVIGWDPGQELSFTDAMTVVMTEYYDIDAVLSLADDFDGVVDGLDRILRSLPSFSDVVLGRSLLPL